MMKINAILQKLKLCLPQVFLGLAAGVLAGCAASTELPMAPQSVAYRLGSVPASDVARAGREMGPHHQGYWWDSSASMSGSTKVIVNLPAQKVFVYKGGQLVGASQVSTGREGYDTPAGTYTVVSKHRDHRSSLYGNYLENGTDRVLVPDVDVRTDERPANAYYRGARMPYFVRLRHHGTGSTAMGFHEGYLPGYAASHGCLRLPAYFARMVYNHVPNGATVLVENTKPDRSEAGIPYTVKPRASRPGPTGGYLTEWGLNNQPVRLPNRDNPTPSIRAQRSTSGVAIPVPTGAAIE